MSADLIAFLGSGLALLVLVALGEALRSVLGWSGHATRRLVHLGTGLFVAATPWLFQQATWVYVLAVLFVLINAAALHRGWLRGLHGITRRSIGTVTFPLVLLPALYVCWTLDPSRRFVLQIAFLVLAVADPLASLVGTCVRRPRSYTLGRDRKSMAGTATFGLAAFALTAGALFGFKEAAVIVWSASEMLAAALVVACTTAAAEALSGGGWDNFSVVGAAVVTLVFFHEHPDERWVLFASVGAGVAFALAAYRLRFLSVSGAVAGGLLAASVLGLGGWAWAVPAFAFFFLSSLLSKLGRARKATAEAIAEKGSVRDAGQVYANGGVAWVLLLIHAVAPHPVLYAGFLGAFAAAAADTWATEIGTLFRRPVRLVTTGRRVPPGTSGGVSIPGTLGACAGALAVGLSAWPVASTVLPATLASNLIVVLSLISGVSASFVDSVLGATIQARYRDSQTGAVTERSSSEAGPHALVRGYPWMTNDRVNGMATAAGALLAAACFHARFFAF